jgi:hypothetical protein
MPTRHDLIDRTRRLGVVVCAFALFNASLPGQVSLSPLIIPNPNPQTGAWFGYWVTTGDLNHDGIDDLAVSAYLADVDGQPEAGRVDIFFGRRAFTGSVNMTLHAPAPEAGGEFGAGMAIGDVNDDGFADLMVGSEGATVGDLEAGRVFVYFGGPAGLDSTPDLILQAPQPQAQAGFGRRVSVGDVNGDGVKDLIVSAYLAEVGGRRDAGEVYGFLGGKNIDSVADAQLHSANPQPGAWFGFSITAGDINGDGFDDIIVGALLADVGRMTDAGRAEIFFGSATWPRTSDLTLEAPTPQAGARFGFPVDVGDVNADGIIDLLVGAYFTDVGHRSKAGKAFIYLGGRSINRVPSYEVISPVPRAGARFGYSFAVGDVIGDGHPDLIVGADLATIGSFLIEAGEATIFDGGGPSGARSAFSLHAPTPEGGGFYGFRLAIADLNGDGRGDLIVAATGTSVNSRRQAGAVVVYLSRGSDALTTTGRRLPASVLRTED